MFADFALELMSRAQVVLQHPLPLVRSKGELRLVRVLTEPGKLAELIPSIKGACEQHRAIRCPGSVIHVYLLLSLVRLCWDLLLHKSGTSVHAHVEGERAHRIPLWDGHVRA